MSICCWTLLSLWTEEGRGFQDSVELVLYLLQVLSLLQFCGLVTSKTAFLLSSDIQVRNYF